MSSMSEHQTKFSPNPNSFFDEKKWVIEIRRTLEEELEEGNETPITIFNVPKALVSMHPDSYMPQFVAIGPVFRYTREELNDMERYKVTAARRNQKDFQNFKFQDLVDQLMRLEPKIRASYQRFLTYNCETLSWMVAIDVSFLLEFLQVCAIKQDKNSTMVITSRFSHLVELAGNKAAHSAILRDISMLENQIPLFALRKLLELHFSSLEKGDEMLQLMLIDLCEELSPFKMSEDSPNKLCVPECSHLLDVLYHYVVPELEGHHHSVEEMNVESKEGYHKSHSDIHEEGCLCRVLLNVLLTLKAILDLIKRVIFSRPVKVLVKLPWTIISHIPIMKGIKEPLENFFSSLSETKDGDEEGGETLTNKSPLMQEIKVPSVTQLAKAGIYFQPTNEGIQSMAFDTKTCTFSLPIISLDVNSEVLLRNLVAYEVCHSSGPLVLARYTELMNGIIDTEEDAKFLRENGIIINRLKSDEEVANLWNGMSQSIKLTKVPFLDKVIGDVNKFYNEKWKVRFGRTMKRYVYGSWRVLTLLAAILMIVFMGLQAFCSVYNCTRLVPIEGLNE